MIKITWHEQHPYLSEEFQFTNYTFIVATCDTHNVFSYLPIHKDHPILTDKPMHKALEQRVLTHLAKDMGCDCTYTPV